MKKLHLIYISGQITGNEKNAFKEFERAEKRLQKLGYLVVNPMKLSHDHDRTWQSYMKDDIRALLQCDGIYMLPNWKESKGAIIEHDLATNLGIGVFYEKTTEQKTTEQKPKIQNKAAIIKLVVMFLVIYFCWFIVFRHFFFHQNSELIYMHFGCAFLFTLCSVFSYLITKKSLN
jgi:hypothetical protein